VEEFLFYGKVGGCSLENQPQSERRCPALPVQSEVAQNIMVLCGYRQRDQKKLK